MRGRPIKTGVNTVVYVHAPRNGPPFFAVVVAYRTDRKWGRYLLVETDWRGAKPRGPAHWRDSTEFIPTMRRSTKAGRIYRKNEKEGGTLQRGCDCQCCHHVRGTEPDE